MNFRLGVDIICYCRVSSTKQKEDLQRQIEYVAAKYPGKEVIIDIGSGINFKRKGLNTILERAMSGEQLEVVVAYKDRLARFGYDLIERVITRAGGRIVVLNEVSLSPSEELTQDLLTILHIFSCRLCGIRKYRGKINKKSVRSMLTFSHFKFKQYLNHKADEYGK